MNEVISFSLDIIEEWEWEYREAIFGVREVIIFYNVRN